MTLRGVVSGVDLTVERPVSEFGESQWVALPTIHAAVFDLDDPQLVSGDNGPVYRQLGSVFVPRGSDLRDGDRITHGGRSFAVVGESRWDVDHAFTRRDFGYVEFRVEG